MGRTRTEIKTEMTSSFMGNASLANAYGFALGANFNDEFSLVSVENILFEIVAYAVFLHELIFDNHKKEVDNALYNQKSGRLPWYRSKALAFQYGFDLLTDSDEFDNDGATDEQIETSKIIKYAAVNESDDESRVIIKIAGETDEELAPITDQQRESFGAYFNEIRYAGVKLTIINYLPDLLFPNLTIYRDPLVLDANGGSILYPGTYPVKDAIEEYMRELPFDGAFVLAHFVDKLQQVDGVLIPVVNSMESSWIDPFVNDYGQPVGIAVKQIPESGYFKVDNYDSITYVV
ncbi:nucleotidyltransferase [Formosa sp. S-31]|uniref:nucleotidyltransferase n=1 Tax=Formosa sp. S-31 TaxID=2790949 RepID=UPI003EBE1AFE